jgi:hypothetical protein
MYPMLDVQTAFAFARLHQNDVHASYPRRRRARTWLRRWTDQPAVAPSRHLTSPAQTPTQHHPAAA